MKISTFIILLSSFCISLQCSAKVHPSASDEEKAQSTTDTSLIRNVLVIGDSIALGQGAKGTSTQCALTPDMHAPNKSFAALVANSYNAELMIIAKSGHGLVSNYNQFASPTMSSTIFENDAEILPTQDKAPELILIELGTNDFANFNPEPTFSQTYTKLLTILNKRYPNAEIVSLVGPMLHGDDAKNVTEATLRGIQNASPAVQKVTKFISLYSIEINKSDWGCSWHPNLGLHRKMAETILAR